MAIDANRRQLLALGTSAAAYVAGAAIVGGAALATAAKAEGKAGVGPALSQLLADYDRTDAELDRWYDAVWNPSVEAHRKAMGGKDDVGRLPNQSELDAAEDKLWRPVKAATNAIRAFPVASLADMAAKLDHLDRIGARDGDADVLFDIVRADVARLSGQKPKHVTPSDANVSTEG